MNNINNDIPYNNYNKADIVSNLKYKRNFFRITDSLMLNKLAYGYFIDRFEKGDIYSREVESLSKYEWFAGSLTAEQFSHELEFFLCSSNIKQLNPHLIEIINDYVKTLKDCNDEGYLIDLTRSSDLRLIFNIATGIYVGTSITPNPKVVDQLSKNTLEKIHKLEVGQKHLFLLGSATHETRLTVERKYGNWEVCYYDSANPKFYIFDCNEQSSLFTLPFWKTVYSYKFSPTEYIEENLSKGKVNTLTKLQQEIDKIGKPIGYRDSKFDEAQSKQQQKNTCHFKSLLSVLKKEVIYSPKMELDEAIEQWNQFKIAFGNFMLQNKNIDPELKIVSEKKQIERVEKQEKRKLYSQVIQSGHYEDTVINLVNFIELLTPRGKGFERVNSTKYSSQIRNLNYLNKLLGTYLNISLIPPIKFEELIAKNNNPFLKNLMDKFFNEIANKQQMAEKKIESETMTLNDFELLMEKGKNKLSQLIYPANSIDIFNSFVIVPYTEKKVEEYLDLFLYRPELLASLSHKPACILLLLQGIQLGKIEVIKKIYDHFEKETAIWFNQILKNFLNQTKDNQWRGPTLAYKFWPIDNERDYKQFKNDDFMKTIIRSIIEKSYFDGSLENYNRLIRDFTDFPLSNSITQIYKVY